MATDPLTGSEDLPPVDALPPAPLSGTRGQSLQRLQIGLFGLGAMVLLVALANIILTNAQENQARVVPDAAPTIAGKSEGGASDPLAEAGVVPDTAAVPEKPAQKLPPETGDAPSGNP